MCDLKNHNLQVVYRTEDAWNEEHVVRWCQDCGAIVVDRESDNRRFGTVVSMRFPKHAYNDGVFPKTLYNLFKKIGDKL